MVVEVIIGALSTIAGGLSYVATTLANFFNLFPIWARALIMSFVFYGDSKLNLPVIGHPLEAFFNELITKWFGYHFSSFVIAIAFLVFAIIALFSSVEKFTNGK